ncbi:MAG TPA: ABC transporter ATP-binding protein [Candidatus Kapabacteria bacterium]|nr:ABC transporter ATP-binding protein [Candidatus Kapabacteria bacterium]
MKSLWRLKPYFARYKWKLIMGLIIVTLSNLLTVVNPFFARKALDSLIGGTATASSLLLLGGGIVLFTFLSGFFMFLTRETIIVVSREIENDMRNDFLGHIETLSLQFFHDMPTGDIMAYSTNDIAAVRNFIGPCIMYSADTITTFVFIISIMFYLNVKVTLFSLLPLPFVSYGVYLIGKRVYPLFTKVQEQFATITTRAQESISGMRVVRAYVRESYEEAQFKLLSWEYYLKNMRLIKVQGMMQPLMFMLIGASQIILLVVGAGEIIGHHMTIGGLTQFMMYLSLLIWPMIAFGWVANMVQRAAASMQRLNDVMDMKTGIADNGQTDAKISSLQGEVSYNNVRFHYPGRTQQTLDDISIAIPRGATVGIIGTTGSGKTTLTNLLPRLYEPESGEVLIDGRSVQHIPLGVLRRDISVVTQEPFLFSDTIRNNIAFGKFDATEEQVHHAAQIAQIHEDITGFPMKYETMVGERGITLSGGQKQRTAIARAIICEPKILILDDALSAVDTNTEDAILTGLRKFMRERTSIMIAHRISTVKNADLIIVMDEGKIIERGTHEELLTLGGMYADINEKQLLEEELEQL